MALNGKKKWIGFSFAYNGLREMMKSERNFKIQLSIALLVIITGLLLGLSKIEWAIIMIVIGLVLVAETVNSAIEEMIDYLNPKIHPTAKKIKDIAAGAVLLAAIIATIVGVLILFPKFMQIFIAG